MSAYTKKCVNCGTLVTSCNGQTPAWCYRSQGCHTTGSGAFYCQPCTVEWLGPDPLYPLQQLRDQVTCKHRPSAAAVQASLVVAGGVLLGGGAPPTQPGAPPAQPGAPPTQPGAPPAQPAQPGPEGQGRLWFLTDQPPAQPGAGPSPWWLGGGPAATHTQAQQHLPLTDTGYRPPDRHLTDAERRRMDEGIDSGSSNEETRDEETQTRPSEMRQECARLDALEARVQVLEHTVAGNVGCVSPVVLDPPSISNRMASLENRVDDLETKTLRSRTAMVQDGALRWCNTSSASNCSTRAP